jgi:EmrB/QacA subfamily drug resistance transporter
MRSARMRGSQHRLVIFEHQRGATHTSTSHYNRNMRSARQAVIPYIVAATFFMEYLDTTVIATALPQMAKSFSVGPNEVSLGMTVYALALAVCIPISGWIADRFGSRTVFAGGLIIFTTASVLCGFSTGLTWFVCARVLQGVGGAMMVPVGRFIVVRGSEKSQLMKAISTITWPAIVAPVIGPTLGGFITTYFSWHWVFFINIPFGIIALITIGAYVPNQRVPTAKPLDVVGFSLSGFALSALLYGTELASHENGRLTIAGSLIAAGIVVGICAVRHLKTARNPLLDLSAVVVPTYGVTVLWGSATRIGIDAVPYLCPLLLQVGFGLSAFHAGLLLIATATGNLGMKLFTTPILKRFGFRSVAVVNATVAGTAVIGLGFLSPDTPLALMILMLFIYGLSRSLQFTTLATLAYADIADDQKGPSTVLWSVAAQMTMGMGIAFGAVCLRMSALLRVRDSIDGSLAFTVQDFRYAFVAAGLLIFLSLIGYVKLSPDAGTSLGGASRRRRQSSITS